MFHSIVNDKIHTSKLYPILKAGYKKGIFDTHTHTSGFFVFFALLCFHSERKKETKKRKLGFLNPAESPCVSPQSSSSTITKKPVWNVTPQPPYGKIDNTGVHPHGPG